MENSFVTVREPLATALAHGEKPLVVVVDDCRQVCDALLRLLEAEGYRVITSSSPWEIPMLLEVIDASLLITDVVMPGLSGIELTREVRASDTLANLPVIVFSAGDVGAEAIRAGASSFIPKDSLDWPVLKREVLRLAGPGVRTPADSGHSLPARH